MKTKLSHVLLLTSLFGVSASAHETSNARAAELSLHRIERLVILKKISGTFLTQLSKITLLKPSQTQPTDPFFRSQLLQVPAHDGSQSALEIPMDHDGKALSFTQTLNTAVENPVIWPGVDSATLLEDSLHCLQGELIGESNLCQTTSDLRDFDSNFLSASILQKSNDSGNIYAEITISKLNSGERVQIRLTPSGNLVESESIVFLAQ